MKVLTDRQISMIWDLVSEWTDYKGVVHINRHYQVDKLKRKDKMEGRIAKINKLKNEINLEKR